MFFFCNDTATTEIYTLSLHDALPIFSASRFWQVVSDYGVTSFGSVATMLSMLLATYPEGVPAGLDASRLDRKSTRLNSSHANISYAVFCLKKTNRPLAIFSFPYHVCF